MSKTDKYQMMDPTDSPVDTIFNISANGLGNIDVLRENGEDLILEGWSAFKTDNEYITACKLWVVVNAKKCGSLIPNMHRPDVRDYLEETTTDLFGFVARCPSALLNLIQNKPISNQVSVYAQNNNGEVIRLDSNQAQESPPPWSLLYESTLLSPEHIIKNGDFDETSQDILSVLWSLTDGCDYRCSYCFCRKTFKHFTTKEQLIQSAKTLIGMNRPAYQISLYGGEPTYHPHCLDLIRFLCESNAPINLRLITNGNRGVKYFKSVLENMVAKSCKICMSLHLEYADPSSFIDVLSLLTEAGLSVGVNFMFSAGHYEKAKIFGDRLIALRKTTPFFFSIPTVYDASGNLGIGCTSDELELRQQISYVMEQFPYPVGKSTPFYTRVESDLTIENKGKLIVIPRSTILFNNNNTPNYLNFYCAMATNCFFITEDCDIRGSVCQSGKIIGNLVNDSVDNIIDSMCLHKCKEKSCNSIENIPIPKFKYFKEGQEYLNDYRQRNILRINH